ncbi:MAG: pyrroline-5-carboxylate reductase [Aestuariibacter sp.]
MQHKNVAFIGAGNMTKAIISGMVHNGYPAEKIMATNRSEGKLVDLRETLAIRTSTHNQDALDFAEVIVLSVKPQMMADMLQPLQSHADIANKLFVSVAAGLPTARLQTMLGGEYAVVRVMPNTPSAIGKGMSGLYANAEVNAEQRQFANDMMEQTGEVVWVDEESMIDGVIAAAGSSPAYFFLFLEAMQHKAEALGFTPNQARKMVQQAMLGSAELVCKNENVPLSELRNQVTSKGGTTAQAVAHLQKSGLETIVGDAMQAAVDRAKEMSEQL